jgi:hypothetical protein
MRKTTNLEMSQDQIEALTEGLQDVKKTTNEMSLQLVRIETLLSGNELDKGDKGMVGKLDEVWRFKEATKKYIWMFIGGTGVVIFIIKYFL